METFGDLKVGDKLYIINDNCTIDVEDIVSIKYYTNFVMIKTTVDYWSLSINRSYEKIHNMIICSNPLTAKVVLKELQENISFSLKKLNNEEF